MMVHTYVLPCENGLERIPE